MPADYDALIGTVVDGRFEIRDKLGQGGMGSVYRAWQRSVGREVAIKLIDRSISNDPMATRRFLREAHLASQLSHPNTISVLDSGVLPDGRLFIAMELVRGRTLGKELRERGAFSLDRIVRIGTQLCDALEAAHAQRIVHRDLKPDNVMLLDAGNDLLKVLDFGLAKTLDDTSTQATAAGIVVGTLRYIAPESAMTGESTPASDMYAVGVILGELALGTPLGEGATLSIVLQHQLQPDSIVARVPEPLRDVVARLVGVNAEQRPTAPETRALLAGLMRMKRAEPAPRATRRDKLFVAGFLVFVASVVVAYLVTREGPSKKPARVTSQRPADPWRDDPASQPATPDRPTADDPWQSPQPSFADVLAERDAGIAVDNVRLKLVDLAPEHQLFVNGRRNYTGVYYARVGERVTFEVWDADHTKLIATSTFTARRDEELRIER
jgi:serine/threonine-protein kinase